MWQHATHSTTCPQGTHTTEAHSLKQTQHSCSRPSSCAPAVAEAAGWEAGPVADGAGAAVGALAGAAAMPMPKAGSVIPKLDGAAAGATSAAAAADPVPTHCCCAPSKAIASGDAVATPLPPCAAASASTWPAGAKAGGDAWAGAWAGTAVPENMLPGGEKERCWEGGT